MASDPDPDPAGNEQRVSAFIQWLQDNHADLSRIEIRTCETGGGNGVYARQDVSADERYAYIPHKLVITSRVCRQSLATNQLSGRALLASFLVHQRFVIKDSFWKPYIDILPANYHTPLEFAKGELSLLQGTPVEHAVDDRRSKYMMEHRQALEATKEVIPKEMFTWENYVWAASAVSSRAFSKELVRGYDEHTADGEVLLPLLDMMNHQPRQPVSWVALDNGIEFVTGTKLISGRQVFNNYGPKSNEELLMGYGFCVPGNPFSHFHIKLNYENDPLYKDKQELLQASGICSCDHYIRKDGLPRDLLPMLRVMAMTDVDVHFALKKLQQKGNGDDIRQMLDYVGLHNELRARYLLLFLVQKKLQVFEAAEKLLTTDPQTENAQVARVYRTEIGEILRATVDRLEKDERLIMVFACGIQASKQTALPWYARSENNEAEFAKPMLIDDDMEQPASKRARPSSSSSSSSSSPDDLEQRFLESALITSDSFASDPEFAEAIAQVDVDPDVLLTLFVVRILATNGSPWRPAVSRLEAGFQHPMMTEEEEYEEMVEEMNDVYHSLFPLLNEHFPKVFPMHLFTAERFVWAAAVVETFRVEVPKRSCPGQVVDAVCLL